MGRVEAAAGSRRTRCRVFYLVRTLPRRCRIRHEYFHDSQTERYRKRWRLLNERSDYRCVRRDDKRHRAWRAVSICDRKLVVAEPKEINTSGMGRPGAPF